MDAGSAVLMLEQNCRFLPLKMKLGRLKRDCNDMGTLMAATSSTPTLIVPRTPLQMMKGQGRERRTAMARVLSITRQIKEVTSVRLMAAWSLWPMLAHRVTTSDVKGGHLPELAVQARRSSSC